MNILIIEDQGPAAFILASLCEGAGRSVDMVETLHDAWARLADRIYDIVFLDLTLPPAGPAETLKEVPAIKKLTRCVVVTGNQDPLIEEEAKEVGADSFLSKHDPEFADRVMKQLAEVTVT